MRSTTRPERPSGFATALGSLGLALVVAVLVVALSPTPAVEDTTPTTQAPRPTIALDDLAAQLATALGLEPQEVLDIVTEGGPVTVVAPSPQGQTGTPTPVPTGSTTTTTTTTTTLPPPQDPQVVGDRVSGLLDHLLGLEVIPTTIPEGAGE